MILFPAIDLVGGRVVRLQRGDRARMDVYSDDPTSVAASFRDAGASWVHVVDLSAALEEDARARAANDAAIRAICSVPGIRVDAGGGVRSMAEVDRLLGLGARRVAVGTALVRDPAFAAEAARVCPDAVVADVAARDGEVRVNGWREGAALGADELVARLADMGFCHLVYTDVARDGMRSGVDAGTYRHVAAVAGFPVVASGGVASLDDLRALLALGPAVVEGAICGRALFEGCFSLGEALRVFEGGEGRCSQNA